MISGREVKVLDINSEYYGTPAIKLMENAGTGVADFIINKYNDKIKDILIFCGTGNNGGDGLVAARYLSKKYMVNVFLVGEKKDIKTSITQKNYDLLKKNNIELYDKNQIKKIDELIIKNDLIIDSMLGIGLTGELREPYRSIVEKINNKKNKRILSVDTPTGINTKKSIKPDYTITFHDIKEGMNEKNCGKIHIVDIKIPRKAVEYIGPGELEIYYPKPRKNSHKGENGVVLVVGGGPYIGAPALSGLAALRTGVDLVYIATPKRAAKAITSFSTQYIQPEKNAKRISKLSPNLIVHELNKEDFICLKDADYIKKILPKINTVIIGPGVGNKKESNKTMIKVINESIKNSKSLVIDADAIAAISEDLDLIRNHDVVVTPHSGEFKKLTDVLLPENNRLSSRSDTVKQWAKKIGVTILLKGETDIITNGDDIKYNDIHNPAMTVGGTGDVLAGITGGLLSKKISPFNAARIAVFLSGSAGNMAYKKYSFGLVSTDIIESIPLVLKKYL